MNYGNIKKNDIANGPGIRTSLFVSGCTHHCKNCFNEETWSFTYGEPFTKEVEDDIIESLKPHYVHGLTLLGGEPFEKVNQIALYPFIKRVRETYPDKSIWAFSGYLYEEILDGKATTLVSRRILELIDVLVDGEFKEEEKDITLLFKGSRNQRTIDVKKSLEAGEVVLKPLVKGSTDL